ncbi:MAG: WD40 repeat domain-containing protein [Patescibacteria group bacterium]
MEKLTLKPQANEIIVNHGTTDGVIDMFSYSPDDAAARGFGSLFVVGHRDTDSSNVGYVVSLISALARREYYANPNIPPREAFSRTLRKANEVVDEFFRNGEVKLSVGIVAIAGSTIMVSKLDKFKILLARENQVIDILSNVLLFSKEHTEKRRFSSIIHGSVQPGDRILAFVPTRTIISRERNLKTWFLKLPQDEFAARVAHIGTEHASFAAAMLHIDMAQTSEPALMPSPQPPELMQSEPMPVPTLAWKPRQWGGPLDTPAPQTINASASLSTPLIAGEESHQPIVMDAEVPRIIPSEFSLGTRRTLLSRWFGRIHFVRLDGRGKAITLALIALLTIGGALLAKSFLFVSPQQQKEREALSDIRRDLDLARSKVAQNNRIEARQLLARALSALLDMKLTDGGAKDLQASITLVMDSVDNAQPSAPTLITSPQPDALSITLAAWSSASHAIWVGSMAEEGGAWVAPLRDGSVGTHVVFGSAKPDLLIGWRDSVLSVDFANRTITRTVGDTVKSYTIPTQDVLQDAAEFSDSLYVLTDKSIIKISDLDTNKPVTKQWLADTAELAIGAVRIWVDGSIWTMSRDGSLTTYYKGKKTAQVAVPLSPAGTWRLVGSSDGLLAIANGDTRRIYLINPQDGSLVRTLKIDSQLPFTYLSAGPDGSVLLITKESKVWQVK